MNLTLKPVKMATSSPTVIPTAAPPLNIFTTISSLRTFRRPLYSTKTLGFVPTMGALHEGHLSLIRHAASENDVVVVSIFVNPAQFSPTEDLTVYPRTLTSDLTALESLNAEFGASGVRGRIEALFLPAVAEMYPSGIPLQESLQRGAFVTVQPLASKLEGVSRPHFFRGVATVVAKLFNIVMPERAYFGQKDVQQSVILRRMVKDLGEKRRRVAPLLFQALRASAMEYERLKSQGGAVEAQKVLEKGLEVLKGADRMEEGVKVEVEYFNLADSEDLETLETVVGEKGAILSAALRMLPSKEGERSVRIIDNIILK